MPRPGKEGGGWRRGRRCQPGAWLCREKTQRSLAAAHGAGCCGSETQRCSEIVSSPDLRSRCPWQRARAGQARGAVALQKLPHLWPRTPLPERVFSLPSSPRGETPRFLPAVSLASPGASAVPKLSKPHPQLPSGPGAQPPPSPAHGGLHTHPGPLRHREGEATCPSSSRRPIGFRCPAFAFCGAEQILLPAPQGHFGNLKIHSSKQRRVVKRQATSLFS